VIEARRDGRSELAWAGAVVDVVVDVRHPLDAGAEEGATEPGSDPPVAGVVRRWLDQRVRKRVRNETVLRSHDVDVARVDVDPAHCEGRAAGEEPLRARSVQPRRRLAECVRPRNLTQPRRLLQELEHVALESSEDPLHVRRFAREASRELTVRDLECEYGQG